MKRILSLILTVILALSGLAPVLAAPELHAESKFSQILNNLESMEEPAHVEGVYFRDINLDGIEEMFVIYSGTNSFLKFSAYCATPSGTSVYNIYKDVCTAYSGGFLLETATVFGDGNSVVIKLDTDDSELSMGEIKPPSTVTYHKVTVNKDYNLIGSKESYYSTQAQYWDGTRCPEEEVNVATDAERKSFVAKYEKGKSDVLYAMGRTDDDEYYRYYRNFYTMSFDEAKKYLKNGVSKVSKPDYSGFDDKTKSISDKDKLKIQNMLNGFNVGDEPVKIDNMNEQQLIELMEYALLRNQNIKPLESYWMGGGGWDMYAPDDFEKLIYDYTGINIDVTGHRCSDDFCIADYNSEKIQAIGEADSEYRKMIKKIDNHEYAVLGRSEFIYYRIPVIKNIYMLDSSTALVIYESCKISPEDDIYNSKQLLTSWDEIEGHDYGRYDLEDSFTTYAIVGIRKQGKDNSYYMIEQGGKSLISAEQAKKYIKVSTDDTNITPDYKKVRTFKRADEFISYLRTLIDGKTPNDSAKAEIVKYMEYAIEKISDCVIKAKSGKVTVDAGTVESVIAQAKKLKNDFEDIINETDFDLNKDIDLCIKADADGAKLSKGITVVFDKSLSEWTGIIDKVKIVLDGANHSVSADSRAIDDMIEAGVCSVRIKCDKNKYTIVFIDENGKEIKNCPAKLTFALESDNEYNVVYYERNGKKENWSGQYNSADSTLEFMTSISGVYYVEENDLEITDISDLPDEQQRAIRFMVSRGYFTLTDSKFNPYGLLSRNDFTKALVSIFYELDYEAKSTFADVSEDDSYYSYIASSQSAEIVKGFEDNTFRGTQNTTKEEVVSIASRTIAEQKGYTYPENTDEYIVFADSDDITYWDGQKGEIALAVREGLIEKGGNFAPKADITRVEAALILYRLFNILYGVTPAGAEDGSFPIIPVAAGGAAVLACGGAGAFFLIKKRRKLI